MTIRLPLATALALSVAISAAAEIRNPEAVVAMVDGAPITRRDLAASLPPDLRTEYEKRFADLEESKARAVRDLIGRRGIAARVAERHQSEQQVIDAEYESARAEIDPSLRSEIATAEEEIYSAERAFLQRLVDERRLARAAAAKRESVETLNAEIESSVAPVSDADVQFMMNYEINRRRLSASGEPPAKQVERAIRQTRVDQKKRQIVEAAGGQPRVEIRIQPPRFQVSADDDPRRGPKDAPVQIVMFSDFECQYCAQAEPVLARLRQVYGDKIAITFRDFPLPIHSHAVTAAKAANCAIGSGKYWEFHDALFAHQSDLSRDTIRQIADSLGLDRNQLAACYDSPATAAEIDKDIADGRSYMVESTPTFFINGRMYRGTQSFEKLASVIDDELNRGVAGTPAR